MAFVACFFSCEKGFAGGDLQQSVSSIMAVGTK